MASTDNKPVITVLTAPDEERPPGLDPLFERASEVRFAWDAETLRQTLPGTHIMMVTDFRTEGRCARPGPARMHCSGSTPPVPALMR